MRTALSHQEEKLLRKNISALIRWEKDIINFIVIFENG